MYDSATHRDQIRHAEGSILDRSVDLTAIPVQWIAWAGVLIAAMVIRLIGRTNWPLAPEESAIARDAWLLLQGADPSTSASASPATVQLTTFLFFLFGDTDYTARLLPLLTGVGVIVALFWMRTWFGNLPSLSIAFVWALSPVMTLSSLRLDGGGLLILSSVMTLSLIFVMGVEAGSGKPIALGIVLAVALTAHPLGWLIAPATLFPAMMLVRDPRFAARAPYVAGSFLVSLLVITSWFVTRPSGVVDFFSESLGTLWSDYVAGIGTDWPLTIIVLIADEPLALGFAIIGLVFVFARPAWSFSAHPAIIISCAAWAAPMLTLGLLLDGKGPALYGTTLIPLTLLGGLGLSIVVDGVRSIEHDRGRIALWALLAVGLVVAVVRFFDLLNDGPATDTFGWLFSALALGLLVILPLIYFVYRIGVGAGISLIPVTLLVIALAFSITGMRGALLLNMPGEDRTGEVLLAGSTSRSVAQLEHRIKRYSQDTTRYVQDAQTPEGGRGLMIAVDEEIRDPFAWYFREFSDFQIVTSAGDIEMERQPDVVLVGESNEEAFLEVAGGYQHRSYPLIYQLPNTIDGSEYQELLVSLVNPLEYRGLLNFIVYRNAADAVQQDSVILMLREEHARPFWGDLGE